MPGNTTCPHRDAVGLGSHSNVLRDDIRKLGDGIDHLCQGVLLGDLRDEFDPGSPSIVEVSDGLWLADGRIPFETVADAIGEELPDGPYATLAGLFLAEFGSIPHPGDRASVGEVELVVDHMDRNRIATMRVIRN